MHHKLSCDNLSQNAVGLYNPQQSVICVRVCRLRQSGKEQRTSSSTCPPLISVCRGHTRSAPLTSMSVPVDCLPSSLSVVPPIVSIKDTHCSSHQSENINFAITHATQQHVVCWVVCLLVSFALESHVQQAKPKVKQFKIMNSEKRGDMLKRSPVRRRKNLAGKPKLTLQANRNLTAWSKTKSCRYTPAPKGIYKAPTFLCNTDVILSESTSLL